MGTAIEQLKDEQADYYAILATGMDRVIAAANDCDLKKVRDICFDIQRRTQPYRDKVEKMAELIREGDHAST